VPNLQGSEEVPTGCTDPAIKLAIQVEGETIALRRVKDGAFLDVSWRRLEEADQDENANSYRVQLSTTNRFEKEGLLLKTLTFDGCDTSTPRQCKTVVELKAPNNDSTEPFSLQHLVRHVRIQQYNDRIDAGGQWSIPTGTFLTTKDCAADFWLDHIRSNDVHEWQCCPCPVGGACFGAVTRDTIVARQGYWRVNERLYEEHFPNYFEPTRNTSTTGIDGMVGCTPSHEFILCPYQERCLGVNPQDPVVETSNHMNRTHERCTEGTHGPMCALCDSGWAKEGSACAPCTTDALGRKLAMFLGALLVLLLFAICIKRLFANAPRRLKKMRKDLFRILIIMINFSQIGTSLPHVFNVEWPSEYLRFLDTLNVFNFNVLELTGTSCATDVDHATKLVAMACFPLVLVLYASYKVMRGRCKVKAQTKKADKDKHGTKIRVVALPSSLRALTLFFVYPFFLLFLPVFRSSFLPSFLPSFLLFFVLFFLSFFLSFFSFPPSSGIYSAAVARGRASLVSDHRPRRVRNG